MSDELAGMDAESQRETLKAARQHLSMPDNGQGVTFSEPCNELIAALVKAQAKMKNPPRTRTVKVTTKAGGSYSFKYAPLDTIIDHVRKPLTENGLWFIQTLQQENGKYRLCTHLVHTSGQYIRSDAPLLVDGSGSQAFASGLTYMRRYCLESVLGLCATDDDDANAADGNSVTSVKNRGEPNPVTPHPTEQHEVGAFILWDAFGLETEKFEHPEDFLRALGNNVKDNAAWFEPNADQVTYIENFHGGQIAHNKDGTERADGLTIAKWCQKVRKLATPPQTALEAG